MIMFCRDCKKNVKVKKQKDKNLYAKIKYFVCKECGVIILRMSENRRYYP